MTRAVYMARRCCERRCGHRIGGHRIGGWRDGWDQRVKKHIGEERRVITVGILRWPLVQAGSRSVFWLRSECLVREMAMHPRASAI